MLVEMTHQVVIEFWRELPIEVVQLLLQTKNRNFQLRQASNAQAPPSIQERKGKLHRLWEMRAPLTSSASCSSASVGCDLASACRTNTTRSAKASNCEVLCKPCCRALLGLISPSAHHRSTRFRRCKSRQNWAAKRHRAATNRAKDAPNDNANGCNEIRALQLVAMSAQQTSKQRHKT